MRKIGFRYYLLRGGAYCAQLRAMNDPAPIIRMDDSGEIKMSFSGTFAPEARDAGGGAVEINWLTDEIQPVMLIDGEAYALGVFMPATPRESRSGPVKSVSVEAYDRCWRVRDTRSGGLLYWAKDTPYLDAIEQLLTASGIKAVFKTPSDAALAEAREWEPGVSYLSVANELLREINYNPLWFDPAGNAILEPVSVPGAANIEHTLDASDRRTRVLPSISRETDVYSAPNVFVCTCANPDKDELMTATAANENPQSPLSVQRRGRQIVDVRRVDNIASQEDLQAYANRLRDESMITGETVRVSTALTPGFGVADVVALHFGDLNAICIERAFDMELKVGGRMNHTLEKVVYNLD